eukprot:TRINITY_DN5569_c0_g1_i2.p1 TRINITY_DN5569_c0_g1~~TRINITY_DN5569_c0_g1_i2.p1  ORF type:complete len:348 (-),score=89.83 TRINITY_DN5569_c0_g1_i2:183-1226(-)
MHDLDLYLHPLLSGCAQQGLLLCQRVAKWMKQIPERTQGQPATCYLLALCASLDIQDTTTVLESVSYDPGRFAAFLSTKRLVLASIQSLDQLLGSTTQVMPSALYAILRDAPTEACIYLLAHYEHTSPPTLTSALSPLWCTTTAATNTSSCTTTTPPQDCILQFMNELRPIALGMTVTGSDLKQMGLPPGPRYLKLLQRTLDARLDGRIPAVAHSNNDHDDNTNKTNNTNTNSNSKHNNAEWEYARQLVAREIGIKQMVIHITGNDLRALGIDPKLFGRIMHKLRAAKWRSANPHTNNTTMNDNNNNNSGQSEQKKAPGCVATTKGEELQYIQAVLLPSLNAFCLSI